VLPWPSSMGGTPPITAARLWLGSAWKAVDESSLAARSTADGSMSSRPGSSRWRPELGTTERLQRLARGHAHRWSEDRVRGRCRLTMAAPGPRSDQGPPGIREGKALFSAVPIHHHSPRARPPSRSMCVRPMEAQASSRSGEILAMRLTAM
jgi:hypothetical protein